MDSGDGAVAEAYVQEGVVVVENAVGQVVDAQHRAAGEDQQTAHQQGQGLVREISHDAKEAQGHQGQGNGGDQEDHREHLVEGESLLHTGHVDTQTAEAAQPLADDRTHHTVGRGDAQTGKELGQGGGELDVAENLPSARTH